MFSHFRLQIATTWTKSSQRPSPTTMTATSVLSPSSFDCRDGSGTGNGDDGGWSMRPMDAEQLRECGHRMVDFIADYYKSIETFSVLSQVQPGYLNELLPDSAPNRPDTLDALFDDIREKIVPRVTHWQSPNYFAYYPSNSSTAGFLGEMLSAAFNIVGFSWITSPAATELEVIVLDWFAKMLKLTSQFLSSAVGGGVIQGSASEAVLVVLLAARDRTLEMQGKKSLEKLVVYASDQTHSALQKACQIAGIFPENFRVVKADYSNSYAVAPEAVSEAISVDLSSGLIPFFICATFLFRCDREDSFVYAWFGFIRSSSSWTRSSSLRDFSCRYRLCNDHDARAMFACVGVLLFILRSGDRFQVGRLG